MEIKEEVKDEPMPEQPTVEDMQMQHSVAMAMARQVAADNRPPTPTAKEALARKISTKLHSGGPSTPERPTPPLTPGAARSPGASRSPGLARSPGMAANMRVASPVSAMALQKETAY